MTFEELTALHAEVSGRNVTLHCKNLELEGQVKVLRESLEDMATCYVTLVKSGDAGQWNPEKDGPVIKARETLKASEKWAGKGL